MLYKNFKICISKKVTIAYVINKNIKIKRNKKKSNW